MFLLTIIVQISRGYHRRIVIIFIKQPFIVSGFFIIFLKLI